MSCEKAPNRVARLAGQVGAGISQLAGKRSFYAGIAVGSGGALGGLALVKAIQRQRQNGRRVSEPQPVPAGPAPGRRTHPRKIPEAALRRPGTRANPRKIPLGKGADGPGTRANPKQIPVLAGGSTETKLQAAPIRMQTGGEPFTPQTSYRVLRPDGSETGLAVTPYVRESESGQLVEDERNWGVTHAASGSLISGPYRSVSQAQGLASHLSGLRWTAAQVPAEDVAQAKQIVSAYRRNGPQRQGETRELRTGSEQDR